MLEGVRKWFASESDIQLQSEAFHPSLHSITCHQNRIRWGQIFLGRFSISWSTHQKGNLSHQQNRASDNIRNQSLLWQTNLIEFVWERWYTLWKLQNQEVHGHDAKTRAEATTTFIETDLCTMIMSKPCYYVASRTTRDMPSKPQRIGWHSTHQFFEQATSDSNREHCAECDRSEHILEPGRWATHPRQIINRRWLMYNPEYCPPV